MIKKYTYIGKKLLKNKLNERQKIERVTSSEVYVTRKNSNQSNLCVCRQPQKKLQSMHGLECFFYAFNRKKIMTLKNSMIYFLCGNH